MLPKGLLKEYSRALSMVMRGLDAVIIFIAGWLAYLVRFNTLNIPYVYYSAMLAASLTGIMVFSAVHLYESVRGERFSRYLVRLFQAVSALSVTLAGLAFFTKMGEIYSRVWFIIWMVLILCLLICIRYGLLFVLRFMRTRGLNERRVVIFGAGELGIKLADAIQEALWTGFRIVAIVDDQVELRPNAIANIPVRQTPETLSDYLTQESIDELWITLPLGKEARVKEILDLLQHHAVTTRFVLDIFGLDLLNHSMTEVAGFPVLNIRSTPMRGINRLVKAIEDRIMALMMLILVSPLLLLISLGIKLTSKGPLLFKQQRHGWDGRVIQVYKFRSMVVHTEQAGQVTQATQDDARITPFGKFLRRTSLDELPQLFNVLRGEMSIVGPRPHAIAHNELYKQSIHTYMQRHRVKPGITGWAQVNGWRGETDTLNKMQKRVEYDLYYINHWSLLFDLKIILLTLFRGFKHPNAY